MKKNFLRLGCILFVIIFVLSTLVGCFFGEQTDETEGTQAGDVVTDAVETPPVPDKDWGGREFSVLSVNNSYEPNFEIVGDLTGDRVSPAVFKRNSWINQKYNVDIQSYGDKDTKSLEVIAGQVEAGDTDYDLVFLYRNDMATAIQVGYMKNLNDVEYLNFSNEWYNQNTIESMKISGKLFHMVSDFSLVDKARTNVLFVNRDMAKNNQIPDILAMVRDGSWTVDKMLEYETKIATDKNGDSIMDLDDQWGLACGGKEGCVAFWNGLGNEIVSVSSDGSWTINVADEHSINSVAKVRQLFDSNRSFVGKTFGDYADATNTFVAGKTLFLGDCLSAIEKIGSEADFSFTALPFPKYDTEQTRYYTTNDNTYCATFGIPVCAGDASFSGFMIEALSWRSSTTTFPEYYDVVCKVKKSYDADCAAMLDLVLENLVFDFGLLYSNGMKLKTVVIQESIYSTKDVSGLYEANQTTAEGVIQNIFNAVANFE